MTVTAGTLGFFRPQVRARIAVRSEVPILCALAFAQFALRMMALFNHTTNTDEPQHMHVIWGWTQGLVQYRDLFDNHAPLFHLLMAPAIGLLGERADIILLGRMLLLPLVALSLWATYRLGSLLWSPRVGAWAALIAGFSPTWLLASSEFRADVLWMAFWLCSLLVLLGGPLTPRRGFLGGLLLGATLATSLKSILLFSSLGLSVGVVVLLSPRASRPSWPVARLGASLAWMGAGLLLIPVAIVLWFWHLGALAELRYCTLDHNVVPRLGFWGSGAPRLWIVPAVLLVLIPALYQFSRDPLMRRAPGRRMTLILATGFFIALLEGCWPLITREDYLPWIPMLTLVLVAGVRWAWTHIASRSSSRLAAVGWMTTVTLVAAVELVSVPIVEPVWTRASDPHARLLGDVLRLTLPHEPIMDLKGETVFRQRPYFFALEGVTRARIAQGLLPDDIPRDVERTRTHFAVPDNPGFPPEARRFLNEHFMMAGALRVLGSDLGEDARARVRTFDVSYAERFAILADGAPGRGHLDGAPYRAARLLEAGPHEYRPAPGETHVIVVWDGLWRRGNFEVPGSKVPA